MLFSQFVFPHSFLPPLCPQVRFLCLAGGFLATGPPGKAWTSLF